MRACHFFLLPRTNVANKNYGWLVVVKQENMNIQVEREEEDTNSDNESSLSGT